MTFASIEFVFFLLLVVPVHWLLCLAGPRCRNAFLLAASYFFYAWWDVRFLGLLVLSTVGDYFIGQRLHSAEESARRRWLLLSLFLNFGILSTFKYFGFFLSSLGLGENEQVLTLVLPVGISFYTFQTLSYTLDLYRREIKPAPNFLVFATFVAFFPQLVAGPIERAKRLLSQFSDPPSYDQQAMSLGFRVMLWGYFKKLVIADNCGIGVDVIFANKNAEGLVLALGLVLFSFQIYADFSGYSDIAIGVARMLGVELSWNFRSPYLSRNLIEFWHRWHISLSTWFRDYLYFSLGGNRAGTGIWVRNILVTFLLSGLWHGANWKFLVWGLLHGLLYMTQSKRWAGSVNWSQWPKIFLTFVVVTLFWLPFRSASVSDALSFFSRMLRADASLLALPGTDNLQCALLGIVVLLVVEWRTRDRSHPALVLSGYSVFFRHFVYLLGFCSIYLFGNFVTGYDFIYFQF